MQKLNYIPKDKEHLFTLISINKAKFQGRIYNWCSDCKKWILTN